jgi:hypothetical protein
MASSSFGRPRGNDIRAGDRVVFAGRGGAPQYGLVRETRSVANPFGGRPALWAKVVWDSSLREPGWMAVGSSLEVVPDRPAPSGRPRQAGQRRLGY